VKFEDQYTRGQNSEFAPVVRYGLRYLIDKVCERYAIDIVILDFGPSASSLNINWLSTCDFILPPTFPDYFSCSSLEGLLKQVLKKVLPHCELPRNHVSESGSPASLRSLRSLRFRMLPTKADTPPFHDACLVTSDSVGYEGFIDPIFWDFT
jgi:hypothetical protein